MLQIKNLTITHTCDCRTIVNDLSFTLGENDRAVVIGEEGNGKSTLLKLIHDPALVSGYAEYTGEITKGRLRTGYLPQETPPELAHTPISALFDAGASHAVPLLSRLGLDAAALCGERPLASFSGSEQVKILLARILLGEPDILLLDEPSNDIDIPTFEWLERFIVHCRRPVLFISHDETLIERTANMVIHLELVRKKTLPRSTAVRLPYACYVSERHSRLAQQAREAKSEHTAYEKQQERFRRIQQRVAHEQNAVSRQDPHGGRLLKKKMKAIKSQERRFEQEYAEMTQFPDVEDAIFLRFPESACVPSGKRVLDYTLSVLSAGGRVLAENISLTVFGGEKLCITGRNGAGKTTLLRQIAQVLLLRHDIRAAYMPQNYEELLPLEATPVEFLAPSGSKEALTQARSCLGSAKYTPDEMDHCIRALSGGQKAKLLFLKMILDEADVLILDEPTRNFSPLSAPVIREILRGSRATIISVSHDRKFISEVCSRTMELTEHGLFPSV